MKDWFYIVIGRQQQEWSMIVISISDRWMLKREGIFFRFLFKFIFNNQYNTRNWYRHKKGNF